MTATSRNVLCSRHYDHTPHDWRSTDFGGLVHCPGLGQTSEPGEAEDLISAITEQRDAFLEFVKVCAGDGYISTRATAKDLLHRFGITRGPR